MAFLYPIEKLDDASEGTEGTCEWLFVLSTPCCISLRIDDRF
jgi:hypothetical protein